ncbi:MAG: rhodanese-like domain-containing protein [Chlamydiota bacterium]
MKTQEFCTFTDEFAHINTATLKILLESKVNLALFDARSPKWDDGQRIPGARSLTSESPIEEFTALIPQNDSLIIVYCSHLQCGASGRLANRLKELGYRFVLKYAEGIDAWKTQGNPINTRHLQ